MNQSFRSVGVGENRRFLNETRGRQSCRFVENFTMHRSASAVVMIFDTLPIGTFEQSEQEKHSIVRASMRQTIVVEKIRNETNSVSIELLTAEEQNEEKNELISFEHD